MEIMNVDHIDLVVGMEIAWVQDLGFFASFLLETFDQHHT